MEEYTKKGAVVIAVNPAGLTSHEKYAQKLELSFPVVSDADRQIAQKYQSVKEDGAGIQRTVYVIGREGKILFAQQGMPSTETILSSMD